MATLSKHRIRNRAASGAARCSDRKKQPVALGSPAATSGDFIKQEFLPLYSAIPKAKKLKPEQIEEYIASYKWLCNLYQLSPIDVTAFPYPYNILISHSDASRQLKIKEAEISLHILEDETGKVLLSVKHVYSTNYTWFYIPVAPVYRLLKQDATQSLGKLLLSVFHYLYHTAKVPYYREHDNQLYWTYEMLEEWHNDSACELTEEEFKQDCEDIDKAISIGDAMQFELCRNVHRELFCQRLREFVPVTENEQDFHAIALGFFSLQQKYPATTIFCHIPSAVTEQDDEEYDDDMLHFFKLISFKADNKGWLNNQLEDSLNSEFQEYVNMEEPCIERFIDHPDVDMSGNLNFEYTFFPLLRNLCILLNELP